MNRTEAKETIKKIEDLIYEANKLKDLLHSEFAFDCKLEEVNMHLLAQFDEDYVHHYVKDTLEWFDCATFEEMSEKYHIPLNDFDEMYPDQEVRLENIPDNFRSCQSSLGNVPSECVLDILRDAYLSEELEHEEMMKFLNMIDFKNHDIFHIALLEQKFEAFMLEREIKRASFKK